MADLNTSFAGLLLKNPIIIGSSGLTDSVEKNKKLDEAGAGALVLKSLFEEQIMLESAQMQQEGYYSHMARDVEHYLRNHQLSEYLKLISESKKACSIPVIASINCFTNNEWVDFAAEIEKAGADALEVNILAIQSEITYEFGSFEQRHIDILKHIKQTISIPVIMKLGHNLTNPITLINQLYANGANAVVLFNRFYQPDINIETESHRVGSVLSDPSEIANSLRWIGIGSARIPRIDFAASGGVHTPEAVIKTLLAGASAVEICSTVYRNKNKVIKEMTDFLSEWMDKKGYDKIVQFKGKLNAKDMQGLDMYERTQFLKYYNFHE